MLSFLLLAAALAAPAPATRIVHVMVHVPHTTAARAASYERALRSHGSVVDHGGTGTWLDPHKPGARLHIERIDHMEVVTPLSTARAFLPRFLYSVRIAEKQQETLGEIFGGAYGTPAQTRVRVIVRLPVFLASAARMERLHRIFAIAGGDSAYVEKRIVTDYSGVKPADVPGVKAQLRRDGFPFRTEQETFVIDAAARH